MSKRSLVVVFLCFFAASAVLLAASAPQKDPAAPAKDRAPQATHLQRGLASFDQGFYELLPKSRRAEADAAFAVAVKELGLALEAEPDNREAHRTLGRICTLKQDHLQAAAHYRRLTEIDPYDLDSYALAALALAEAGRFGESRTELERAEGRTADPHALAILDGYLAKLAEAEKLAGAGR